MTEEINHEKWRVVATGGLNMLLARMQSIADIDTRARLQDKRDFLSWLRVELAAAGSLAFAVSGSVLGLLWDEVQTSAYYATELRAQEVPMVTGAAVSGTDTLIADAAPEGYTNYVYQFDGLTFEEKGPLDDNSKPGTGGKAEASYVLVTAVVVEDEVTKTSLPSGFLTLTA